MGSALTHDVISRLARLRSLFVIAHGSVFSIAAEGLGLREIGERLGVDYVATGYLERRADGTPDGTLVTVEVAEAATARILWTDGFEASATARLPMLDPLCDGIVSSIAAEIEAAERNRTIMKPPDTLDAWESYHRGLWRMYNFTAGENARAAGFFRRSILLDPTFSRSWADLSFTHSQNAFQRWDDREAESRQALEAAGRALLADSQNPAAHWAMGRALWLSGEAAEAARALEQPVHLSPNFARGHYAVAFVHSQAGDPDAAIASSDHSRLLSPCDPLLFGMLGARTMALVRLGRFEEVAEWGMMAPRAPARMCTFSPSPPIACRRAGASRTRAPMPPASGGKAPAATSRISSTRSALTATPAPSLRPPRARSAPRPDLRRRAVRPPDRSARYWS